MSIQPSAYLPPLIHVHRHADNGFTPDDQFYGNATAAIAHEAAYGRKVVFRRAVPLGTGGGTTGIAWRWHCRTGYAATRLVVYAVLGLDDHGVAVNPYLEVRITRASMATTDTVTVSGGESTHTATDAPEEFIPFAQTVDVVPNEVYTGEVEFFNNVRVIALLVFEDSSPAVDDANPPHSEWVPSAGSAILDGRIGQELAGVGDMLRVNGALDSGWCHLTGIVRTATSATLTNLIDGSTTGTPTAGTPGFTFDTDYRRTIAKAQTKITLAVYASVAAGGPALLKLRDTSGNDAATVTINNATPQWFTASGALTIGSAQKYDLMFASDGTHNVSIYAVSIYEEG